MPPYPYKKAVKKVIPPKPEQPVKIEDEPNGFYTLRNILKYNADYNIIYGERSNGKTTAVLKYALEDYINSGYTNQLAIIRRTDEDFQGGKQLTMFDGIIQLGWIEELTDGAFNSIYNYSKKWYLAEFDENGTKTKQHPEPFATGFALSQSEHYKSNAYPEIKTVFFDEFITRTSYLTGEFVLFQNMLSTIIRQRDDVKIFMCGNTVNRYCPYFKDMGLRRVRKQEKGTIDLYTYGEESGLVVATEFSDFPAKKKASNKYFAFDNPKLKMITNGAWEIDIYPHLPKKYLPKDVIYKFYVSFDEELLQGNIITSPEGTFIYMHEKTTPIREDNEYLVYQLENDYRRNYRTDIFHAYTKADKKIADLFTRGKVFYQDNEVGELMNNYIKEMNNRTAQKTPS